MQPDPDEHSHPGKEDLQWGPGVQREKVEGLSFRAFACT